MEPLSPSSQPVHDMVPVFFVLSFVLLSAFLLLGRVINLLSRRQWLNGAATFFWLLLAVVVGFIVFSLMDERITLRGHRMIGQATAALVPSLVLAFFLGKRFRRKVRAGKEPTNEV